MSINVYYSTDYRMVRLYSNAEGTILLYASYANLSSVPFSMRRLDVIEGLPNVSFLQNAVIEARCRWCVVCSVYNANLAASIWAVVLC